LKTKAHSQSFTCPNHRQVVVLGLARSRQAPYPTRPGHTTPIHQTSQDCHCPLHHLTCDANKSKALKSFSPCTHLQTCSLARISRAPHCLVATTGRQSPPPPARGRAPGLHLRRFAHQVRQPTLPLPFRLIETERSENPSSSYSSSDLIPSDCKWIIPAGYRRVFYFSPMMLFVYGTIYLGPPFLIYPACMYYVISFTL
jgi:hypothetical protein